MTIQTNQYTPSLTVIRTASRAEMEAIQENSQVVVVTDENVLCGPWRGVGRDTILSSFVDTDSPHDVTVIFAPPASNGEAPIDATDLALFVLTLHMDEIRSARTGDEAKRVMLDVLIHAISLAREGMARLPF